MTRSKNLMSGCKQSVYFPDDVIEAVGREAKRLDRSLSWVVQRCIKFGGLEAVQRLPTDSAEAAE